MFRFYLLVFFIGFSSLITQLSFLREICNLFYGNELSITFVLASWLFISGVSSYLAKFLRASKKRFHFLIFLISCLPLLLILLARTLRNRIFLYGAVVDPLSMLLFSSCILAPYCIASGFSFNFACRLRKKEVGKVYWVDSIGDLVGSIAFSFLLIYFLNLIQILELLFLIGIIFLAISNKKFIKYLLPFFLLLTFLFVFVDLNLLSLRQLYRNQQIVYQKDSPFGNLVVTKTGRQLNFFENNILLFSTQTTAEKEETVHYGLSQLKNVSKVLVLSGGISSTLSEVNKYNPKVIDYVEIDSEIIRIGKKFRRIPSNVNIYLSDARFFVKNSKEKYDAIIVDLPDPTSLQLNRFYTVEFFKEAKRILSKEGVISISLSCHENYFSPEIRELLSSVYFSLKEVFKNVLIIPGDTCYLIASDSRLSYKIANLLKEKNITTRYVNEYYLSAKLTKERIGYTYSSLINKTLNYDFKPVTYAFYSKYWLSFFGIKFMLLVILITLFAILSLLLTKEPIPLSIFTTGFLGSCLEILIIFSFQIIYGYIYSKIGFLIASFMLGTSLGSYISSKKRKNFLKKILIIELFCFFYPLILLKLLKVPEFFYYFYLLMLGMLVGLEFPLASEFYKKRIRKIGKLYFADLAGGSLGSLILLISLPLIGLKNSFFLASLPNFFTFFLLLILFRRWQK